MILIKEKLCFMGKLLGCFRIYLECLKGFKSPGKFRASSRGKTEGASVIRDDWA